MEMGCAYFDRLNKSITAQKQTDVRRKSELLSSDNVTKCVRFSLFFLWGDRVKLLFYQDCILRYSEYIAKTTIGLFCHYLPFPLMRSSAKEKMMRSLPECSVKWRHPATVHRTCCPRGIAFFASVSGQILHNDTFNAIDWLSSGLNPCSSRRWFVKVRQRRSTNDCSVLFMWKL
jgi:hypothetical protein